MIEEIFRNFLEIESLNDLNEVQKPSKKYTLNVIKPKNFQLNKFLYKQVGKKCHWVDRLVWTDQNWMAYISKENILTYILKNEDDLVGYFELIFHEKKLEIEKNNSFVLVNDFIFFTSIISKNKFKLSSSLFVWKFLAISI